MTGSEIKALRRALDVTARKLGEALGVDQATVLAWEREELFPTKRHVSAMLALSSKAQDPPPQPLEGRTPSLTPLADPAVWKLFRKLLAHPELRAEALALAEKYPDPAGD